jgi:hypothetical protein
MPANAGHPQKYKEFKWHPTKRLDFKNDKGTTLIFGKKNL